MRRSHLVLLIILSLIASLLPVAAVVAADGDNLRTIIADRTGTNCASTDLAGNHGSVGVGIAFDGTNLLISCYSDNTIVAIDPADGSQVEIHTIAGASSLGALAWDDGRGLLWACSNFSGVGTIDLATDVFTPVFTSAGCFDGLAYDGSDDTLWSSGDVASTVEHYATDGTPLSSNPVSLGGIGNSGIAIGGANLYLANNGASQMYVVPKDFSSETLFATFPARLEDLECDNLTFAGVGKAAIWSIDAYDNILNAWEIPAGACEFGGGDPGEGPCGPMDVAFIIDDTGSMGAAIANVKADSVSLLAQIDAASGGDDQLALVSFKDSVQVIEDLAAGNDAAVSAGIAGLVASGGNNLPEASDEALNTVINGLDAADRAPGQQTGDFNGTFRAGAVKIAILVTDALPGGFDDAYTAGVDDANAHARALEAAAAGILISAIYVPTDGVDALEAAIMTDYATTTGGTFTQTNADGTGTAAAISAIIDDCGRGNNLTVDKFYDANTNGVQDGTEPNLADWMVTIDNSVHLVRPTPVAEMLEPGDYVVAEQMPVETNWVATTATSVPLTVEEDQSYDVLFGNVCLGGGGGKTLGYWSNKNGQALVGAGDLAMLSGLHLRNADGSNFDPATYPQLRTWLLKATGTNMAYMLSAQLAAMALDVHNGLVSGSALVYAPGAPSANAAGFTTVSALMADADASLAAHGSTPSGDPNRAAQASLKDALDAANNNLSFAQAEPCGFTFEPEPVLMEMSAGQ